MKRISVHRGESLIDALVDDEDYDFLAQHRWRPSVRSSTTYASASVWTPKGFKIVEMHRMVIGDLGGYPLEVPLDNGKTIYILPEKYSRLRKMSVDHIDGNGLNNTRANLRHLSCSDQLKNRKFFSR